MASFIPAIMSGGSGTRLWPVSRQSLPKQFAALFGEGLSESLFAKTARRLKPFGSPWTITVADMKVLTEKTLAGLQVSAADISAQTLYEPRGRNTAPAIALLCRVLETRGLSESVVGIFPADQLIRDEERFHAALREAIGLAESGEVVTLGIRPSFPATGYGYIETSGPAAAGQEVGAGRALRAVRFREKPDLETAKSFLLKNQSSRNVAHGNRAIRAGSDRALGSGGYLWNAGMFVFRASKMIELLKEHAPKVWQPISHLKADLSNIREVYDMVEAISIDYAVMERLPGHVTIPCDFDWSDVGSWDAIAEIRQGDAESESALSGGSVVEVVSGAIEVAGSKNFVLPYAGKSYAFVGTDDLLVVDTQDATLIAKRGQSEKVKDVVDRLKAVANGATAQRATQHPFEIRPWGKFEVLRDTEEFKSKTITVDAGAQLSLQSHAKRAEHWIIVRGEGEVVLNDKVIPVGPGSHVFIPIGAKHRMRNTAPIGSGRELIFVEIQLGTYFGEDDIVRYEDTYGRT
jgi:mannose-1-phosphate guanylyltransferase/mannose-6-phosphate isomerase-like protein (cupin superfamily)